ncbi:LysR substrate-binding domain-containing protein [Asanoa sp. NPDC050611]|uniref:LysR substrate-binding domain-containing protein n=1 Tax=Asanoa sp. NPDC050611 TaxID=3157098 RepID=UPI0033FCC32E
MALADLAGHELAMFPRATAPEWYDEILDACRRHGFTPRRVRHARNPDFLLGLVLGRQCVAFEPESTARREARVAWRPLAGAVLERRTSAVWPDRSPHPAAPAFGAVAAAVLTGPEPVRRLVSGVQPWSVVYDTPSAAVDHQTGGQAGEDGRR